MRIFDHLLKRVSHDELQAAFDQTFETGRLIGIAQERARQLQVRGELDEGAASIQAALDQAEASSRTLGRLL